MGSSETLRAVIDAGRTAKRLDELSAARVIGKIAEQVHTAQQKAGAGKAIGPITPAGITIETNGAAKLGLAEPTAHGYSAPEQVTGGTGDRRSDVFSLGAVMWEALTHERLFDAMNDAAVKAAVQERPITNPSELNANIPAELGAICMKALARNPSERYQSAKVMAAEIEAVLEEAGYADTDERIAEFLAELGKPKKEPRVDKPPVTITPATGVAPPPVKPEPGKPSILDKAPAPPPPAATAVAAGTMSPPASPAASSMSPSAFLKPAATPPNAGANLAAALASAGAAPKAEAAVPSVPRPPVLPSVSSSATAQGFASAAAVQETDKDKAGLPISAIGTIPGSTRSNTPPAGSAFGPPAMPPPVPSASSPEVVKLDQPKSKLPLPKTDRGTLLGSAPLANEAKPANGSAVTADAPKADSAPVAKPDAAVAKPAAKADSAPVAKHAEAKPAHAEAKPAHAEAKPDDGKTDAVPAIAHGGDAPRPRGKTNPPHPASVVALPGRAHRESQGHEVLGGWGWKTDSHASIPQYEEDYELPVPHDGRKTLIYVIGGGMAVVAIILVIVFTFGGSSPDTKKKPAPTAAMAEGSDTASVNAHPASGTNPSEGSAVASGAATAGSSDTTSGSATGSDTTVAAAGTTGSAGSTEPAGSAVAMSGSSATPDTKPDTTAPDTTKPDTTKPDTTKPDTTKPDTTKPDTTKPDTTKPDTAKTTTKPDTKTKPDTTKTTTKPDTTKPDTAKTTTKPDVAKTTTKPATTTAKRPDTHKPDTKTTVATTHKPEASKAEVEAAYKQGLQMFMRGDTSGALASLRTSLAGNPSYPPTWRALGLVFEKQGEKDQARAAFKRYLQLSPNASDADQIRNRLERLGS